jgi:hypothetical protein
MIAVASSRCTEDGLRMEVEQYRRELWAEVEVSKRYRDRVKELEADLDREKVHSTSMSGMHRLHCSAETTKET